MNKFKYVIFSLLMLSLMASLAFGQVGRELVGGRMVYITNSAFTDDQVLWPLGEPNFTTGMLSSHGVDVGVRMSWVDEGGIPHEVKVAEAADNRFTNMNSVVVPVPNGFKRVFKYPFPARVIDGKNWQDINSLTDPVDPNLPSTCMIYTPTTTWVGINIERWAYGFANDDLGDIVILEWLFTNTSGEVKNDVYFALRAEPATSSHYPGNLWGNYIGSKYATGEEDVRLFYNFDADVPGDQGRDDRGDPTELYGNFRKPQYAALALLHADASLSDESNGKNWPLKGGWSQRQLSPDLNSNTHEQVYAFFHQPWSTSITGLYTVPESNGMIRILDPALTHRDIDPTWEQEKAGLFTFGPFTMNPGDDYRVVMGYIGGTINGRLAIDAGYAYDWGAEALRARKPMPYSIPSLGITAGQMLTMEQKDAILDTGLDSLINNARKATEIWANGTVRKGSGSFNIDLAPPSPSLTTTSHPGYIELEWGTEAEDNYSDVKGYRLYRNYYRPPSIDTPTDTSFVLIKDFPGTSVHSYKDENVSRGQDYRYYLTAYNSKGVESSRFMNRASGQIEEGVSPTRAPDPDWKNKVVVVPNPYHLRGALKYSGAKLNFLNTPAYCKIHIYTMTGDLVQTLYHNEGTGDEAWDRQDTFSTMAIVSGIYLYVVEELDGPGGSPTGETAIGKFIVVK